MALFSVSGTTTQSLSRNEGTLRFVLWHKGKKQWYYLECLPKANTLVATRAFLEEPIDSVDNAALVITSQYEEVL